MKKMKSHLMIFYYKNGGEKMYRIKVCGIKTEQELDIVCRNRIYGVSAVGFITGARYETPDEISPEKAGYFLSKLPHDLLGVIVTHLNDFQGIEKLLKNVLGSYKACSSRSLSAIALQLQDCVSAGDIKKIKTFYPPVFIVKAVHIPEGDVSDTELRDIVHLAGEYAESADLILLDSKTESRIGGTGKVHNWEISRIVVESLKPFPVVLAGGLNPENVEDAVFSVRPFGVDANSGLKDGSGFKNEKKVRDFFIKAARALAEVDRNEEGDSC